MEENFTKDQLQSILFNMKRIEPRHQAISFSYWRPLWVF